MRGCEDGVMVGMYCAGSDCETESTRMRACRLDVEGVVVGAVVGFAGSADVLGGSKASDVLWM